MVRLPLKTQPGNARVAAYLAGILILAVVFVPLLTIDLPPLVDYPNHLARQYILAELPRSETLRNFYQADWHATPYLAMDGIVQTLAHAMSVGSAAKVFVALMLFLLAFAPFALNLALFGRITPAALIGLLFVHNTTVSLGFVPYIFSLGFGLCLLALWIRYREGPVWVRLGLFPVLATSLFFCHLIGFAIYGLTVAAYELGRHLDPSSPGKSASISAPFCSSAASRSSFSCSSARPPKRDARSARRPMEVSAASSNCCSRWCPI
jgi:hypothetical protein